MRDALNASDVNEDAEMMSRCSPLVLVFDAQGIRGPAVA